MTPPPPNFSTPAPASFTFGSTANTNLFNQNAQPQGDAANDNSSNMFGQNNTSFGATFGAGNQQNGTTPATSTLFNFASTQNGPSFGAAQNVSSPAPVAANPFAGFGMNGGTGSTGSTALPAATNTPFSGFGGFKPSPAPEDKQGEKPSNGINSGVSNMFGQSMSQPSTNMFGSIGQSTQPAAPPAASSNNASMFGGSTTFSQSTNGNMFGAINKPAQNESQTPKAFGATSSMFGASAAASNPPKTNMFGNISQATPSQNDAQSAASIFGQTKDLSQPSSTASNGMFGAKATESMPSFGGNMFGSAQAGTTLIKDFGSSEGTTPSQPKTGNMFGSVSTDKSQTASTASLFAPKPAGFAAFGQSASAPTMSSANQGGQTKSQTTSSDAQAFAQTPKPAASAPSTSTTPSLFAQKPFAESATASEAPKSLVDRIDPAKTQAMKDAQAKETSTSSFMSGWQASSVGQNSTPKPTAAPSSAFGATTSQFSVSKPAAAQPNAPSSSAFGKAALQKVEPSQSTSSGTAKSADRSKASTSSLNGQEAAFRQLNQSFLVKLQHLDRDSDWTSFMDFYTTSAAIVRKSPAELAKAGAHTPKAGTATANIFSKASSTAPPTRKRSADLGDSANSPAPPATEKRSKGSETNYPKLPENSSSTSRLFAAALDKPKESAASQTNSSSSTFAGFKSSASSGNTTTPATAQKTGVFNPSFSTPSAAANSTPAPAPKFGGFTPKASTTTPATAQKAGGFMPTFSATSTTPGNFMAAFGKNAQQAEKEAKEKRKLEDYDSEEETLEDWEKRDAAEQEAKKAALAKSAQTAKPFTFTPTTAGAKPTDAPTFKFTTATPNKTTAPASTTPATSTAAASGGIFSFLSDSKQNGTSTTPKSSSLFGTTPSSSLFSTESAANAASPAPKYTFGQSIPAANTTGTAVPSPGTATKTADDNNSDGDEEEAHEPPADLSALLPEEKENQEVLFELPQERKARTYAVETNKEGKKAPVSKGIGKPFLLKSKITGRARILFKIDTGKAVMNYDVVKGGKYGVTKKTVHGPFLDHIHSKEPKLTQFQLAFSSEEFANKLLKMLEESA
jgi:hypothetical protein